MLKTKNKLGNLNFNVVIPARSGSKGLKNKNILPLLDKPLISYTLEAAKGIFQANQIIVSTDSLEIKKIVEAHDIIIPRLRPKTLSGDVTPMSDVILDIIEKDLPSLPDYIIILQPTSPLRNSKHIREAMHLIDLKTEMIVSVCESKSNPYWNLFEENEKGSLIKSKPGSFTCRQHLPLVYRLNGAIYIIKTKSFLEKKNFQFNHIKKYVMSEKLSIDIDSFIDFKFAEMILQSKLIE